MADQPVLEEPGLRFLIRRGLRSGTLEILSDFSKVGKCETIFVTVGTPSKQNGGIDTQFVESASKEIGRQLSSTRGYRLVVVKSTVTPGTTENSVRSILERESGKKVGRNLGLASNPEFLHEGSAVRETLHPEAVVIGGYDKKSRDTLLGLYESFYKRTFPRILTTPSNAEMIKYAINAGRATQLSFVNTIANLCTRTPGCDYDEVRKGLSMVARMDQRYLAAGMGFGGSCVPPHTRVVTESGFQKISEVRVGDRVLSHDGLYHKVAKTFVRHYDGMMFLFKAQGFSSTPLFVTPEHPILSCLRNTGGRSRFYETLVQGRGVIQKMTNVYLIEPPDFAYPSSLSQGDFMVLPAFKENSEDIPRLVMDSARRHYELPLCADLMYLFGLWLAEGILDTRRGEVLFSLHAKETYFLEEIDSIVHRYFCVRAGVKKSISKGNSLVVRVKSKALALFLERTFGRGAENKRVPWEWLSLPGSLLIPLIRGIWYGDGSNRNTEFYPRFTYATTSINLADFMEIALLKLKVPYRRLVSKERIDKNGVHHRKSHHFLGVDNSTMNLLLPRLKVPPVGESHRTSWFEGNYYVYPIKDVQVVKYAGKVHNLEVEGVNSYVVEGATLHNCLPKDVRALSAALKKAGTVDEVVAAAMRVNEGQVDEVVRMAERMGGSLDNKRVSVLGLAFKAGTDDIRESVAIALVRTLIKAGAEVSVYDPAALKNAKLLLGSQVTFAKSAKDCIQDSECAFIATGWEEFKGLRPKDFASLMRKPVVVDGRRIYDQKKFRKGGVMIETIGTGPAVGTPEKHRPVREWHYSVRDGNFQTMVGPR